MVEVGAAVVDCGITTDTAAVSEMKRILVGRLIGKFINLVVERGR